MTKVAVIVDFWFPQVGGGQINTWEISKRIASKNIQIDIITRNCGNDHLEKVPFLKVYKLGPKTKPNNLFSELLFLANLFVFLIKRHYDLIHVHPFLPALIAKPVSIVKGIPVIFTVHGTRLFEKEKKTPSRLLEKFILTGIKYDAQISVTSAFLKIKNINKKPVMIPNGVDTQKFSKIKVSKYQKPTILWVGRFDPVKRVEDLIYASKILSQKFKNLQVLLVGYGYQEKKLKELASDLKLKNIKFMGHKNDSELATIYKKSHVFALPSSSEGQPLTILEAQASSLPVVATRVGGIPEIVEDKKTGILVQPNNVKELSEAIAKVLKGKNNYGQNGLKFVKRFYTWDVIAAQTKKLYQEILHD